MLMSSSIKKKICPQTAKCTRIFSLWHQHIAFISIKLTSRESEDSVTCSFPHNPSFKSPLQSKARLTFEFITWRVLSNQEIPYQALIQLLKTSNKENYKIKKVKVTTLDSCCICKNVQNLRFSPG